MLQALFFTPPLEQNYLGHQLAEIYKDRVYADYFAGKKDLTIFDIGGNIGVTSYYFSQFAKKIYTFEPAQEHFDVLVHQLAFNKITNVEPFRAAISNEDGQTTFYHQENKTMFSLRPAGVDPKQTTETVQTVRLDTFFAQHHIDHVDFMKLDVEGSEMDIICGDGFQHIANKIDTLFLERHSWSGRNPNQLLDGLRMAGFTQFKQIPNQADLLICTRGFV